MKIRTFKDKILATDIQVGQQIQRGIILLDDDGKDTGIHPRWCRVHVVGEEIHDIEPGQWIYVEHGRWSRGVDMDGPDGKITLRTIDPKAILMVSDECPFTGQTR